MNKFSMIAMAMLLGAASSWARPALKGVTRVTQPDGTTLCIRLQGDEYRHWNTTADGFSIVKNANGFYVYAQAGQQGQLEPTALVAHDGDARSPQEQLFLEQTGRLVPKVSPAMQQVMAQNEKAQARARQAKAAHYDYENFKGLVILVEYNDRSFRYANYSEIMEGMINSDGYTGTSQTNFTLPSWLGGGQVSCTGSMRDYFRDNSDSIFIPTFDIVGPVQINRSQYYSGENTPSDPFGKTSRSVQQMVDACAAADSLVNFKDYDLDNDGKVDMIYFVFAGLPSYIQGNDPRLLWPHQYDVSYIKNVRKDGVYLGRYACSTELFGYESNNWSVLEGIGTMCHEFSHVLGLPDFYDTGNKYDETCIDPGEWSVMANGADFDYGRRPCGYSLFERYALGWAMPQELSEPGSYTLDYIAESNTGYRISTPQKREYFMLENRQRKKWDAKLPGHGMLVFRVDSTSTSVWTNNTVNDNPAHPYYEMVRARGPQMSGSYYVASGHDPFPGSSRITQLDNETAPANLLTWAGKESPVGLANISERSEVISFDVFDAHVLSSVTLPVSISLGVGTSMQLEVERKPQSAPYTFVWTSDNEEVAIVDEQGLVTGTGDGEAVITLTANDSLTATCRVWVKAYPLAADIASMCAQEEGSQALLLLDSAQVLYRNGTNIYLRDASGAMVLSGTGMNLSAGNLLNGSIFGTLEHTNKMPVLKAVKGETRTDGVVVGQGDAPEPVSLHISEIDSTRYADMVAVRKVKLTSDGGIYAEYGGKRIRLYNYFKISNVKVPSDLSSRYDITAIFGTNTLKGEVIDEFYLLKSPQKVSYTELKGIGIPESVRTVKDRSIQLNVELTPANADVFLEWTSSNEQVATVTQEGLVTTVNDGVTAITVTNLDNGLSATCLITVGDRVVTHSIAEFKALAENAEADLMLNNALVVFAGEKDAYLRDGSGAICLAGTGLTLHTGDLLNGTVYGRHAKSGRVSKLLPVEGFTNANGYELQAGQEVLPREVELSKLTDNDYADLIVLKKMQMTQITGLQGLYVIEGERFARIYNTFGLDISVPKDYEGKNYNLTGILLSAEVSQMEIDNLALTMSPEEVLPDYIIVTAKNYSRLYGEPNPVFEYTTEGAPLIGEPVITCEATETSPVGVYEIVLLPGTLGNDNATLVNGILTVRKTPLNISVGNYTKEQWEPMPEFVLTYNGFVNGEDERVLTKMPEVTCEATADSAPGEYRIVVSGAQADNYNISHSNGVLTVVRSTGIELLTEEPDAIVTVFTSDGRLLMQTTAAQLKETKLKQGVYLVRMAGRTMKMVRR